MGGVSTRGLEITVSQKLVTETCCNCGILFAMTADLKAELLKGENQSERSFYCPRGHGQHYTGKSEAQELREELAAETRARQRIEQDRAYQSDMRVRAERSAVAYKGQATRLRNRSKAGVCPCCNRTFKQLAAHMAGKHPDFRVNPDGDLPAGVAPVLGVIEGGRP